MQLENSVTEHGSGPPIVFLHGSYASPATWKGMTSILARDYHCILISLPGHGGTPRPDDFAQPSLFPEFEILDWVLQKRCDGPAHLVGHSSGGGLAMAYGLRDSRNLCGMTLFEPGVFWILRASGQFRAAQSLDRIRRALRRDISEGVPHACGQVIDFWGGLGSFDSLPPAVKDVMSRLERDNLRHWELFRDLEGEHEEAAYQDLDLLVRLVQGERSNPITRQIVAALDERLPKSHVVEIEDASHFLVTTHPEQCAAQVLATEKVASQGRPPTSETSIELRNC